MHISAVKDVLTVCKYSRFSSAGLNIDTLNECGSKTLCNIVSFLRGHERLFSAHRDEVD